MNSKYSIIQLLLLIVMGTAIYFFVDGFRYIVDSKTVSVDGHGITTVTIDSTGTYYFSFDQNYGLSSAVDVYKVDDKNRVDFITSDAIYVTIRNTENGEYTFIDYYDNGTLIINNFQVIGSLKLSEGTYDITVTDAMGWLAGDQTFQIVERGFGYGIAMVIVMPIVLIITFIAFIIIRVRHKRLIEREIEFDGNYYQSKDANELFEMDNVWDEQKNVYNKYN